MTLFTPPSMDAILDKLLSISTDWDALLEKQEESFSTQNIVDVALFLKLHELLGDDARRAGIIWEFGAATQEHIMAFLLQAMEDWGGIFTKGIRSHYRASSKKNSDAREVLRGFLLPMVQRDFEHRKQEVKK